LRKLEQEICSAARHGGTERAEAREVFELERVNSCGSGDDRWRTKLNSASGEPFDDLHRAATLGAKQKIGRVFAGGSCCSACHLVKAKRQKSGTPPSGQEAEVPDTHEAFGEQVQ
jgi:hypothetical protein